MATSPQDLTLTFILGGGAIGWLGIWINGNREKAKARREFAEKQLREFYSPVWARRQEILALSSRRMMVAETARRLYDEQISRMSPEALMELDEVKEYGKNLMADIPYYNKQFDEVLLPRYKEMRDLFRDNMALAERSTLQHWPAFIGFIDTWDMSRSDPKHDLRVLMEVGVEEIQLHALYDDLDYHVRRLRAILQGRKETDSDSSPLLEARDRVAPKSIRRKGK